MSDPVIVTSSNTSFEPIILDFDTKTSQPTNAATHNGVPLGMGNAMLEAVKTSLFTKLNAWREERFQSFRPVSEFLNRNNLGLPKV